MPKKKQQIDEKEIAVRSAVLRAASMTVTDVNIRYELANAENSPSMQGIKLENPAAMMQWSNDCVVAAARIAESIQPDGWNMTASQKIEIEHLALGMMNYSPLGHSSIRKVSRLNVWKRAPYCFVDQKSGKIVAYFVGNKAISRAESYAWQYEQILRRSKATEEMQRRGFVFAKHAAVCYYTLTGKDYSRVMGTFPMMCAFAGDVVGDETLENVCRLIMQQNYDGVGLPDCWQMLHK